MDTVLDGGVRMKVDPKKVQCVKCKLIYRREVRKIRPIEQSMYNSVTKQWIGFCSIHYKQAAQQMAILMLLQQSKENSHVRS